jgi:hypothetical protein
MFTQKLKREWVEEVLTRLLDPYGDTEEGTRHEVREMMRHLEEMGLLRSERLDGETDTSEGAVVQLVGVRGDSSPPREDDSASRFSDSYSLLGNRQDHIDDRAPSKAV